MKVIVCVMIIVAKIIKIIFMFLQETFDFHTIKSILNLENQKTFISLNKISILLNLF